MATIIILELEKSLISPTVDKNIRAISKFYEIFKNKVIAILLENRLSEIELYNVMETENVVIELYNLNNFARNRLINNLEEDRPDLTLTIMGASSESKLIKVWKKNDKK